MTHSEKLRRRDGLSSKLLPDNFLVVVDDMNESALTLNPTGAVVWEYCDGEHSEEEIVEKLSNFLQISKEELCEGVHSTLQELKELGLLIVL